MTPPPGAEIPHAPRCLAVLTVRNEGAFLLEWLAHHRAVGFNSFLVFSNDCQDGTDLMLDRLAALGLLVHVRNDGPDHARGIQFTALKAAQTHALVREADWILPLDVDEFVNIKVGDHRLPALFEAVPTATAITLTWRLFGNADVVSYTDAPVTEQFTCCAPEVLYWPWRASMFKTLYQNDGTYRALGVHRPRTPDAARLEHAHWVDCQGRSLPEDFKTKRIFSTFGQPNYALAQLNHYPLGAMESFVLKSDRGRAVHAGDTLGLDYWVERNFNTEQDTSIQQISAASRREHTALLADTVLSDLHHEAVAWRKARFAALMQTDAGRDLFGRLMMTRPSRLVGARDAEALFNYGRRATDATKP